jgi:hypothetical protein
MVHHVAPEQCVFAPGTEADAGVVDAVTGPSGPPLFK